MADPVRRVYTGYAFRCWGCCKGIFASADEKWLARGHLCCSEQCANDVAAEQDRVWELVTLSNRTEEELRAELDAMSEPFGR